MIFNINEKIFLIKLYTYIIYKQFYKNLILLKLLIEKS